MNVPFAATARRVVVSRQIPSDLPSLVAFLRALNEDYQ
jgi:hypothetical protein